MKQSEREFLSDTIGILVGYDGEHDVKGLKALIDETRERLASLMENDAEENPTLKKIMSLGYDVRIECKGLGRVYAMTYEATAHKNMPDEYSNLDRILFAQTIHAVGGSIEEMAQVLLERIKMIDEEVK